MCKCRDYSESLANEKLLFALCCKYDVDLSDKRLKQVVNRTNRSIGRCYKDGDYD